jgi:hypothetical protein
MLRVEASNLPKPRGTPRARRLLPAPPVPRHAQAASRHELLPPPNDASPPTRELALPAPPPAPALRERWSVRLELGDDDIAKLYGQGMTRGAVVWKKGMVEWRPLLITPELSGLLHRTRITLIDSPALTPALPAVDLASPADELTLPRPARLPSDVLARLPSDVPARLPSGLAEEPTKKPTFTTIAPLALDIETDGTRRERQAPPKRGRSIELVAVAAAAFALAWIGHAKLHPQPSGAAATPLAVAAAVAPVCAPPAQSASSAIPTVAVADLPLVGATSAASTHAATAPTRGTTSHSRSTSAGGGPTRSELVGALSQVARAASSCGERGGPVRVVVSFANSGVARSIQVSGADLPSTTRSCIIGAASRARVAAFSGDPVTVAKSL